MRIAVDAMGGDFAPEAVLEGVLQAIPRCKANLVLIGDEARLQNILGKGRKASSVEVIHAPDIIGMGEAGPMAIRRKREASLSVAMRLLAEDKVDAVVSAGNSSAVVATAKHFVGLMPGLRRPAMAVPLPTPTGKVLLLDAGAYAEAGSIDLIQSAVLANAYLKVTDGLTRPRIGLLNIGQEPLKGTRIIQRASALLEKSRLHFIGNVEPQGLLCDQTDAAVCDGFVGNVVLKLYEGFSETLSQFLEARLNINAGGTKEVLGRALGQFREAYSYQNVGGVPLLGIRKPVIVAHGRSQGPAIASAALTAFQVVKDRTIGLLGEELGRDSILNELKHNNSLLMFGNLKNNWGFARESG